MKQYRHIEALLRFTFRDLPGKRTITTAELENVQERLVGIEADSLRSVGVASYDADGIMVPYRISDPTGLQGIRMIHRDLIDEYTNLDSWRSTLSRELREYDLLEKMGLFLLESTRKARPQTHTAIVGKYRDGQTFTHLATEVLYCDASTIRRNIINVFQEWDTFLSPHISRHSIPICASFYPALCRPSHREAPGNLGSHRARS
jgi:hypothetical protein